MPEPERPGCSACGAAAIAQWRRRPTEQELAAERERVTAWRTEKITTGRVPENYDFGPLLEATDIVIAVFGCADHLIHIDLAARVHAADCPAPHPDHLPNCGCTPEPAPEPEPEQQYVTLPTGWVVPATAAEGAA